MTMHSPRMPETAPTEPRPARSRSIGARGRNLTRRHEIDTAWRNGRLSTLVCLVVVLLAAAALAPTAAVASTASSDSATVVYTAEPGEVNNASFGVRTLACPPWPFYCGPQVNVVVVSDSGASVISGPGCAPQSANSAWCENGPVMANLGDGDDTARVQDGAATIDGGPGADIFLRERGRLTVDYSSRTEPVNVSPDGVANDGSAGEQDNVPAGVWIQGGSGDDVLAGSWLRSPLYGNDGDDVLTGPAYTLYGGNGNDTIKSRNDDFSSSIYCGDGTDIAYADKEDFVDADCEVVRRA